MEIFNNIPDTPAWNALKNHFETEGQYFQLKDLFRDPERFNNFHIRYDDFLLDFSKNLINKKTFELFIDLVQESGLEEKRDFMFSGNKINTTENRAVLHTALRSQNDQAVFVDGNDIMPDIKEVLKRIETFSEKVRSGDKPGYTGKPITHIVNIGIGGSDLGPKMICEALKHYKSHMTVHFVSNIDPADLSEVLKTVPPEQTLFLVASKTFTTQETMTNALSARKWLTSKLGNAAVSSHFAAMSTNRAEVEKFGIDPDNMFEFWDFVGGRYSSWSAIGLPIALYLGYDIFADFLSGGFEMDEHFKNAPLDQNLPVILALIGIWYNNFWKAETAAVLPYAHYLHRFAAHLQQLDMESNGKTVTKDGKRVIWQTGPVIWGEPGTNGQHAFYQLIHQGTKMIPADFIAFKKPLEEFSDHHEKLIANFLAQTEALAFGLDIDQVKKNLKERLTDKDSVESLAPHKVFTGNRPTNSLLINALTPKSLGKLLALYEHKVFIQGVVWNINSFDQMGVELGKVLAKRILADFSSTDEADVAANHDNSTYNLIKEYLKSS